MQVKLQKIHQEVMENAPVSEGVALLEKDKVLEIVKNMEQQKL